MSNVVTQLPLGVSISQIVLTPTTSAQTHTLTNAAKGVRIVATGLNPAVTTAASFVYLCFVEYKYMLTFVISDKKMKIN